MRGYHNGQNKSGGFTNLPTVRILNLSRLYKELATLAGLEWINEESFNALIDKQKLGEFEILNASGKAETVKGFLSACRKAPCALFFRTGFRCAAMREFEILLRFKVERKKYTTETGLTYDYLAKFDWVGRTPNGSQNQLYVPQWIGNYQEVMWLATAILDVTIEVFNRGLQERIVRNGLGEELSLDMPGTEITGISLPVLRDENDVPYLNVCELLDHPRCPVPFHYFPVTLLFDKELLHTLAEMAEEEKAPSQWQDLGKEKERHHDYWALGNYLINVFTRLVDDHSAGEAALKTYPLDGQECLCFCTGLHGRQSGHYIYGICRDKDEDGYYNAIEWVENDYSHGRNPRLPPSADDGNYGLPYPANWTRNPSELICQYKKLRRLEDRTNFTHILEHHSERLPDSFFWKTPEGKRVLNKALARNAICDAIHAARKQIQANYRYAIPGYYRGHIMLQLPLCLEGAEYPNAYLVLTENKEGLYEVPTLLTPAMAYTNSRAITPQESTAWEHNLFDPMRFEASVPKSLR